MKVVLRADASVEIGTGHVMRQFALAEELIAQGAEVTLVGEITGPDWLVSKLARLKGLQRLHVPAGSFNGAVLEHLGATCATIDSYAISQSELADWENRTSNVLIFLDGPWQQLRGELAVVPTFDERSQWLDSARRNFRVTLAGPDFLIMRREIQQAKERLLRSGQRRGQILVSLGGADQRRYLQQVESALEPFLEKCRVVIFGAGGDDRETETKFFGSNQFLYPNGSRFVQELVRSSFVVSAAGTSAMELFFLRMPAVFIPVAENQELNAEQLESMDSRFVVRPDSQDFHLKLSRAVNDGINQQSAWLSSYPRNLVIDGHATRRISQILLSS